MDEGAVLRNVDRAAARAGSGEGGPALVGVVAGSEAARARWERLLAAARPSLGARRTVALCEDLPVNQAFGLLLLWHRVRDQVRPGDGALFGFVLGDGSRAAPFPEAEAGEKGALTSFVRDGDRWVPVAELALRAFAPVEAHLRRSGFDGLVVKWGDEIQVPDRDLMAPDPRLRDADVVRFVSMRRITAEDAASKDWLGVSAAGDINAFVPRRPLAEMARLADRGVLRRDEGGLVGGVNLGSIAVSRRLLDLLGAAFEREVRDPTADRGRRPDLDPQLFTALTVATIADPAARDAAWRRAVAESPAIGRIDGWMPDLVPRLREVVDRFAAAHGRAPRLVAVDFGAPWWADLGEHARIRAFYQALNDDGPRGTVARALAGIRGQRDEHGNYVAGACRIAPGVRVRGSVLLHAWLDGEGEVVDSVLVGTRAGRIRADRAFDVLSVAADLSLGPGAGGYRGVSSDPVTLGPGERWTTMFGPDGRPVHLRGREDLDLRDRAAAYDRPVLGNRLSFRDAHALALATDPSAAEARRAEVEAEVSRRMGGFSALPP